MYRKFAKGTTAKAQGTKAFAVGAVGYFEACESLTWIMWIGHTIGGLTVYSDEVASYDIVLHAGITY